jgi:hypothetical protein|tara:strand:+ start:2778 stop:3425 length:648 start_codon:yes stop_codon:yes gene_type:complete
MRLVINNDNEAESPLEHTPWTLISFNNKHTNSEDWGEYAHYISKYDGPIAKNGVRQKIAASTAFWLSYFEHGQCAWSLYGEGTQCRWDTTRHAGIILGDYKGLKRLAQCERASSARDALETYTNWSNGNVYEYAFLPGNDCPHCGRGNNVIGDRESGWTYGPDSEWGIWHGGWYDTDDMFAHIRWELKGSEHKLTGISGDASWLADHHELEKVKI